MDNPAGCLYAVAVGLLVWGLIIIIVILATKGLW
jgi:hypothetical protein